MSKSENLSDRRDFLCAMLALVPTLSIAACTPVSKLQLSPARAYVTRYFTEEERTVLDAACSRLIPTDVNGPGAVELGVPEFIDREMEGAFEHATT